MQTYDDSTGKDPARGASAKLAEREKLLEHQLRYLYGEILQLRKDRYEAIYTASWLIVRPLLLLEQTLGGVFRRFSASSREEFDATASRSVDAPRARAVEPRRILVDVTGTVERDMGTGIERVTKDLSDALVSADPSNCVLVRCDRGRLLRCVAPIGAKRDQDSDLAIEPGDQLLILADAWNYPQAYAGVFEAIHDRGGRVIVCVHDVIPELFPAACHERTVTQFSPWLRDVLLKADGVLTVSRASAADLLSLVEEKALPHRPGLPIGWFHNASRFEPRAHLEAREKIRVAALEGGPFFLCVGTLEPRKGQLVALEAFERLWAESHEMRLVFVGRRGWFDYALVARIAGHDEYGRRLFWLDDVDDAELAFLYAHMSALVCPSFAEGFGLPVIEASRCGKPVFCSDIPVFREVGQDGALYFPANDPAALAHAILQWRDGASPAHPERVAGSSWRDAAARIMNAVKTDQWDFRLA